MFSVRAFDVETYRTMKMYGSKSIGTVLVPQYRYWFVLTIHLGVRLNSEHNTEIDQYFRFIFLIFTFRCVKLDNFVGILHTLFR